MVSLYFFLLQLSTNSFGFFILREMDKNTFARLIATYPLPEAVLTCSIKKTTSGRAAAIRSVP